MVCSISFQSWQVYTQRLDPARITRHLLTAWTILFTVSLYQASRENKNNVGWKQCSPGWMRLEPWEISYIRTINTLYMIIPVKYCRYTAVWMMTSVPKCGSEAGLLKPRVSKSPTVRVFNSSREPAEWRRYWLMAGTSSHTRLVFIFQILER